MRTRILAAPMLGLSLILAACGSSGGGATTAPSAAPATEAPSSTAPASEAPSESAAASESPSAAAGGGVTVNLTTNPLGSILTGADGKTLYIFTADSGGKSVCNGDCATAWPPLMGDSAPTLGTGLDTADFSTITRDDGTKQVAFYGMPLYYFAADTAAGDTKGQGLNDKWYVVGAEGTPIK